MLVLFVIRYVDLYTCQGIGHEETPTCISYCIIDGTSSTDDEDSCLRTIQYNYLFGLY